MIVHPPMHYFLIGQLMRFGMTLYYAEATPTLVMVLLCVFLIVRSPFTAPVKIGFLYGLWVSMAALSRTGVELFGMRPEGELNAAWLAGLILLESGRLKNWDPLRLFLGTLLMAYACTLHYYAGVGALGVVVYLMWATWSLRRRAWKACLAIIAGGLLWSVPFALLFLWPNHVAILRFANSQETLNSFRDVLQAHWNQYGNWVNGHVGNFWLRIPVSLDIPLVLMSTPVLLSMACTRGIALAAMPLELFILLAHHKHNYYFIHELALYAVAVGAGSLTMMDFLLLKQKRMPYARHAGWALFAISIAVSFWNLDRWSAGAPLNLTVQPQVHESEIARAAGRVILGGPYATVATRIASWYSSGGTYWYNPAPDLLWQRQSLAGFDAKAFFSHFDAVVENPHMSDDTSTRNTIPCSPGIWTGPCDWAVSSSRT